MSEETEKEDILGQLPAWYVELRNAYLRQLVAEEKKKRASSKLFAQP
jgi:hypothetical protein